jgi:ABC-2 type transport system ATP-binding protein
MDEAEQLADRLVVLARGRVVADTTPATLRASAARTTIRYRLPAGTPRAALPCVLREHVDRERRELLMRTDDVAGSLQALAGWARRSGQDLSGVEVGPPSLEAAYLALTRDDTAAVHDA